MMTGRIVDSYTNIPTVKLFSHADREAGPMRATAWTASSHTVHRQMRLVTLFETLLYLNNSRCSFSSVPRDVDLAVAG